MKINREHIKKTFQEYTDRYDSTNPKIKLKIDHTYRVANLCEQIAQSLELSAAEVDLAWLSGMLHDVGRFEQLRRYNTFSDAQSIDHARFAVELLYDEGLIADYVPEISTTELVAGARTWRSMGGVNESHTAQSEDMPLSDILQTLRIAIGEHSAYRIQKGLDERTRMFCQILRDAVKGRHFPGDLRYANGGSVWLSDQRHSPFGNHAGSYAGILRASCRASQAEKMSRRLHRSARVTDI